MANLPKDLPAKLRAAGLTVIEIEGWETRGRPGSFDPVGVLNHHTGAFDRDGDLADDLDYAKWLFLRGRADLPAPLCQIALSAEGTVYLGAAGRANHGGVAKASGSVAAGDANTLYIGIEWMLSGTQVIPAKMMKAATILNAVLTQRVTKTSVQAVSCHYQTSVTGKWDIGDPNGIPFGSAKVLNVPKFRVAVQAERDRLVKPPTRTWTKLHFQHTPLQFSDNAAQKAADVDKIFKRGKHHLSGTESAEFPLTDLVVAAAKKYGYRLHTARGVWVAVQENLLAPNSRVQRGYVNVIESFEGAGKHTDRGIVWLTYQHKTLGKITIGCAHYLTNGRKPGDPNFTLNRRLAEAIGVWAVEKGKGKGLVFYSGDQNIVDRTEDTFFGSPLTSAWDEIGKYENTGHGNIDVVASYDEDNRVTAKSITALDDTEFPLHADHFLVDAVYTVKHAA